MHGRCNSQLKSSGHLNHPRVSSISRRSDLLGLRCSKHGFTGKYLRYSKEGRNSELNTCNILAGKFLFKKLETMVITPVALLSNVENGMTVLLNARMTFSSASEGLKSSLVFYENGLWNSSGACSSGIWPKNLWSFFGSQLSTCQNWDESAQFEFALNKLNGSWPTKMNVTSALKYTSHHSCCCCRSYYSSLVDTGGLPWSHDVIEVPMVRSSNVPPPPQVARAYQIVNFDNSWWYIITPLLHLLSTKRYW